MSQVSYPHPQLKVSIFSHFIFGFVSFREFGKKCIFVLFSDGEDLIRLQYLHFKWQHGCRDYLYLLLFVVLIWARCRNHIGSWCSLWELSELHHSLVFPIPSNRYCTWPTLLSAVYFPGLHVQVSMLFWCTIRLSVGLAAPVTYRSISPPGQCTLLVPRWNLPLCDLSFELEESIYHTWGLVAFPSVAFTFTEMLQLELSQNGASYAETHFSLLSKYS